MPNPKSYSRIAIAVSAALTSMVFSAHAAWVDVDSLPSSGLVSSLPPELQAIIPAQANASFAKTSAMPNYVYQWSAGTIPVYGNGLTINGPGAEAFEHSVTVIQNSTTGSPGVIFGDDLTIRTQSKNAANNGKDVALHAPTPGGLLALVGQRGFSSTPLVVWNKGFPVVVEVGKQLPPLLLFVGIQCALNRCLHHSNRFFDFTCMK